MKTKLLLAGWVFIAILLSIQACKDDEEEPASPEFIASSIDFANFRSWTLVTTNEGNSTPLGGAHQGTVQNTTRTVYIKDDQNKVDGKFPVGTIIVKETKDVDGNTIETTALVMRGNKFNTAQNGWEWFMLMPDGTIGEAEDANGNPVPARSERATGFNGMCGGCHGAATGNDFVFSR